MGIAVKIDNNPVRNSVETGSIEEIWMKNDKKCSKMPGFVSRNSAILCGLWETA
jgi:hypothetical protein